MEVRVPTVRAATAAAQAVEGTGNVFSDSIFDVDDLVGVVHRDEYIHLLDHVHHTGDMLLGIAQSEHLGAVKRLNSIRGCCHGLDQRDHLRRSNVLQLDVVDGVVTEGDVLVGGMLAGNHGNGGSLGGGQDLDELVADVSDRDAVELHNGFHGLNTFLHGEALPSREGNRAGGQGGWPEDGALDQVAVDVEELVKVHRSKIDQSGREHLNHRVGAAGIGCPNGAGGSPRRLWHRRVR